MKKHAYMIICHNNFHILEKLLLFLDDERNDIYIHVDKKVLDFPLKQWSALLQNAKVFFVERIEVEWGGYSQIEAELILLRAATKESHSYYHLLSGVDFPLKKKSEIFAFFEKNNGKEFIEFDSRANASHDFLPRIRYYHWLQDHIGRKPGVLACVLRMIERVSLKVQKILCVDRTKKSPVTFYKGTNWFSITHDFAVYVLEQQELIQRYFRHSKCADEIFLQTISMSSPFRQNIVDDCLRYIDWDRGNPYTFSKEDYGALTSSEKIFARKFDESKDFSIVSDLFDFVRDPHE